ncbi:MAG: ABC transporter substrate-binding protein [Deltaproteobacteria bacterium]|nr:ABC transporter substrate-binding protein [Deltaproteobacteria bacterium]
MKRTLFAVATGTLFLCVALCAPSWSQETIKFGATYGMTGTMGWIGQDCVDGARLIIDQVNDKGGIKGKKIELIEYDSKNNPDTAVTNFQKLLKKDGAIVVLGPVTTAESLAVLPIAQQNKIPFAVVSGGVEVNDKILPEYKKDGKKCYLWAMSIGTTRQNEVKTIWLKEKGKKKLAVVEPLNQMGDLSAVTYKEFAKKYGLEFVAEERFDEKGNDFTPQLSKIKAAGADCIGSMAAGGSTVTLVKNRDQVGMKDVPMTVADANLSQKFIELLGENTANVYTVGVKIAFADRLGDNDPQKKVIKDFQAAFEKKFSKQPKSWFFAAVGYDSALMFIKGIEAVGTDGEKIRDWLEAQSKFPGVQAVYAWNDLDHRGIGVDQASVMAIQGNDWVPAK